MTDTRQGGPEPHAAAPATGEPGVHVQRDPNTGMNRDMPGNAQEAQGLPRNHTWGCTEFH